MKDKVLHYQCENKRLELYEESKFDKIEKLEKMCALNKAKECDEEKKWIAIKKEYNKKIETLDRALK